jgi:hypothetical protein
MNGPDNFEERLRRQPLRTVPPDWRDEILRAAREAATPATAPAASRRSRIFMPWLCALLWPHPRAWAGLAAVWLVVLGLNFAARDPGRPDAMQQSAPPSPQMRELLRQQEQMLAELIGPVDYNAADRPKPAGPQPHSERRQQFFNA